MARPGDKEVEDLLSKFVCVRVVQAYGMDLSLFQFDYDLTLAVFFLNADRTIYGRWGTESPQNGYRENTVDGLTVSEYLAYIAQKKAPGQRVEFTVNRGGKSQKAPWVLP